MHNMQSCNDGSICRGCLLQLSLAGSATKDLKFTSHFIDPSGKFLDVAVTRVGIINNICMMTKCSCVVQRNSQDLAHLGCPMWGTVNHTLID